MTPTELVQAIIDINEEYEQKVRVLWDRIPVTFKEKRIKLGISQQAVADIIGHTHVSVTNAERAPRGRVALGTLLKMAEVLDTWQEGETK